MKKLNIKPFQKTIKSYKDFILTGKVSGDSVLYYQELIDINKKIISLLKSNSMTSVEFNKFDSRFKWEISSVIERKWLCSTCKTFITDTRPNRMFFDEDECICENCDSVLTRRTGGGQSDPFNFTFED